LERLTANWPTWPALPAWLRSGLVLLLASGILVALGIGLARSGSPLVVEVDGQRREMRTHAATVSAALRHAGVQLYPEDQVSPPLDTALEPGILIRVRRARPVAIRADGHTRQVRTHATMVGAVLAEAGVGVGARDEIWLGETRVRLDDAIFGGALASRQVSYRGGARSEPAGQVPTLSVRRATALTLDDDGETRTLYTTSATVGQVLEEAGVRLYVGDAVIPALQAPIAPAMKLSIERSVPVQIHVDGHVIRTRTRAQTVAGALGEERIALVGKDEAMPALSATIQPYMAIRVTRIREELIVEFDPIPYKTVRVGDPGLEIDHARLVTDGQVGLNKRRYRVIYENGQEVTRFLEDSWAEQPPITKTLAYGTKIVVRTLETPDGPIEYWRKMRVYLTSYMPSSCGKPKDHPRYGYTRLGIKLRRGIVATDPTVIPLKTWMYVPGYGIAKAGDTGGGVKGKFVDLGFTDDDYESWHWWGDIYLLTPVPPASQIRWILPDYPKFPDRRR
jgi:uncharacterized protein YabE (DUF348 family)/3D (Asp-Asp-Asp) domain-containing protein